jgi:hypothetical protein
MHSRTASLLRWLLPALVLSACTESAPPIAAPDDAQAVRIAPGADPHGIPTRSEERPGTLIDLPDAALWRHIAAADGMAVVGLKAPGRVRGVYRGELLLSRVEWRQAHRAVESERGVSVLEADDLLPLLKVRIESAAALSALRRLPIIDYVEPIRLASDIQPWASTGGCGWPGAWTGDWLTTSTNDGYSVRFSAMNIPAAWAVRTAGAEPVSGKGLTIGSIDTGIASTQAELRSGFAQGSVKSRWVRHFFLSKFSSADDVCGHGTRMAGVIAAPDDGRGMIGVAWGANLINVRHADGVANVSSSDARASVRAAADNGSQIISMAWQSLNWWWQVSDEIKWWHYNRPILFLGAAGTSGCGDGIPDNNVVFPAEMTEVLAVTGIAYPGGSVPCGIHYGSQVELTAYLDVPTTGRYTGEVTSIGGSSNATGIVAGIAALTWQANPTLTRDQLRQRLRWSGANYSAPSSRTGYGLLNAHKAVTGQ